MKDKNGPYMGCNTSHMTIYGHSQGILTCQACLKVLYDTNQMFFRESKNLYSLLRYSLFKLRKYKALYGSPPNVLTSSKKSNSFLDYFSKNNHRNLKRQIKVWEHMFLVFLGPFSSNNARFCPIFGEF